jgi:hypothetical protein
MIKSSLDTSNVLVATWPSNEKKETNNYLWHAAKYISSVDPEALSLFTFWREMNWQVWLLMLMAFTDFVTMNTIFRSATAHHKTQLPGLWIPQDKIQGGSNMTGTDFCVNIHNQSRSYLNHLVIWRSRLIWIGRIWIHFLVKNIQYPKLNREMNKYSNLM